MPRRTRTKAEQKLADAAGPDFLEALARGLHIIEAFSHDRRALSLSDIARLVDLPRASVRRTLLTLVRLGHAETDGRLFKLTPRILRLASAYLSSNPVSDILQPALERLSGELNEGCSAAVRDDDEVMMIAHASPNRVLAISPQIGFRLPALTTSLGRVLLAALDDDALTAFLAQNRAPKLTSYTVVDKSALRDLILKTRADGYSLVDQEAEAGFRSISVPLSRRDGKVIAALNVGVHCERGPLNTMHNVFLPKLLRLADDLRPQML